MPMMCGDVVYRAGDDVSRDDIGPRDGEKESRRRGREERARVGDRLAQGAVGRAVFGR